MDAPLLEVVESVTNQFLASKNLQTYRLRVISTISLGFAVILWFFRKKSTVDISVHVIAVPASRKNYLLQFSRYRDRFAAFYLQLNCAKICGNGFLNFCLNFFTALQSQKKNWKKFFLTLKGSKKFWGQKM